MGNIELASKRFDEILEYIDKMVKYRDISVVNAYQLKNLINKYLECFE